MELHLEAITCLYLWPWSALYKVLISISRHLTPGQASDEYINLAVSGRPEIYKFLYRKYGARIICQFGRQVTQGQDDEFLHESAVHAPIQPHRRYHFSITTRLLPCWWFVFLPHNLLAWSVGGCTDGCPTNTRATCMDRPQSYSLMRCRPRSRGVGGCDS
jgi:hypothetical protein